MQRRQFRQAQFHVIIERQLIAGQTQTQAQHRASGMIEPEGQPLHGTASVGISAQGEGPQRDFLRIDAGHQDRFGGGVRGEGGADFDEHIKLAWFQRSPPQISRADAGVERRGERDTQRHARHAALQSCIRRVRCRRIAEVPHLRWRGSSGQASGQGQRAGVRCGIAGHRMHGQRRQRALSFAAIDGGSDDDVAARVVSDDGQRATGRESGQTYARIGHRLLQARAAVVAARCHRRRTIDQQHDAAHALIRWCDHRTAEGEDGTRDHAGAQHQREQTFEPAQPRRLLLTAIQAQKKCERAGTHRFRAWSHQVQNQRDGQQQQPRECRRDEESHPPLRAEPRSKKARN